jgi:UDP:flavonoid glycosyltransferase YjiC (YdhE family)
MRVLMATWDCGGNLVPFIGLGEELVRRGHDVVCLGSDAMRGSFSRVGVKVISAGPNGVFDPLAHVSRPEMGKAMATVLFGQDYADDFKSACLEFAPDLVVVDYCLNSALAMADFLKLPTAVIAHTPLEWTIPDWDEVYLGRGNLSRERLGLPGVGSTAELWSRADIVLATTLEFLDGGYAAASGMPLHYTGPIFEPAASAKDGSTRLAGDKPTVLLSFSTTFMYHEEELINAVTGAAQLDVQCLVTTGPAIDPDILPTAPNIIKRQYIPHEEVMPYVSAAVVHGGHGSVAKALWHGLPLLLMPLGRDQIFISSRVAEFGAGIQIGRSSSPETVAGALAELLQNPSYRERAAKLRDELRKGTPGATKASELLESIAARTSRTRLGRADPPRLDEAEA